MLYAKNKGADQPANLLCMVGAFAVRCPDSAIYIPATPNIIRLRLYGWAGRFGSYLVANSRRQVFS